MNGSTFERMSERELTRAERESAIEDKRAHFERSLEHSEGRGSEVNDLLQQEAEIENVIREKVKNGATPENLRVALDLLEKNMANLSMHEFGYNENEEKKYKQKTSTVKAVVNGKDLQLIKTSVIFFGGETKKNGAISDYDHPALGNWPGMEEKEFSAYEGEYGSVRMSPEEAAQLFPKYALLARLRADAKGELEEKERQESLRGL